MSEAHASSNVARMTVFERGAYVLVVGAIAGLLGWIGISVTEGREATARLEVKVEALSGQMTALQQEVKQAAEGTYTAEQALRELQAVNNRLDDHEGRLRSLEQAPGRYPGSSSDSRR